MMFSRRARRYSRRNRSPPNRPSVGPCTPLDFVPVPATPGPAPAPAVALVPVTLVTGFGIPPPVPTLFKLPVAVTAAFASSRGGPRYAPLPNHPSTCASNFATPVSTPVS
ncbi:hypothetical protein BDZ91DRAFT_712637 [Kalaharituber pfeilii]|nr:hypothetical protein BDZ91DRAFT_712637 [Kalaharituber pfeilii]